MRFRPGLLAGKLRMFVKFMTKLADFDALPIGETCQVSYVSETAGQGHKCGHDGHSSMLAGLALELDQSRQNNALMLFL